MLDYKIRIYFDRSLYKLMSQNSGVNSGLKYTPFPKRAQLNNPQCFELYAITNIISQKLTLGVLGSYFLWYLVEIRFI
jgi:hypothetical protein